MEHTLAPAQIQILPEYIANQIAAGEVVQRPESVVKELVENALDAGATTIAVVVRGAGKQLLHVIDNGGGMSKNDLPLALKRHATSKIRTTEDLHRIATLGFRGEALASIASVAHVEIRSRQASGSDTIGWKLLSEPLQEPVIEPCAMDTGTQVFVRNLFYNVPARRKFLRSDLTEFRHIADTMLRFALGHPHVRFVLYDDDAMIYDLPPHAADEDSVEQDSSTILASTVLLTQLRKRIADALSSRFATALVPVQFADIINGAKVEIVGFVGQPQFAKKTKSEQFLYLNGRTITSRQLGHALLSAYEHLIDHASYPPYVLFVTLDVERVDVNVHPQKHEVKFDDERVVYSAVRRAVSEALQNANLAPQAAFRQHEAAQQAQSPFERFQMSPNALPNETMLVNRLTGEILDSRGQPQQNSERGYAPPADRRMSPREIGNYRSLFGGEFVAEPAAHHSQAAQEQSDTLFTEQTFSSRQQFASQEQFASQPQASGAIQSTAPTAPMRFLWQLHKKYILMQTQRGLVMIDQHAAHERILYERALKAMSEGFAYGQELLFPVRINLTPSEAALVRELAEDLKKMGFQMTMGEAADNSFPCEIHSIPADVRNGQEESALKELLEQYREYNEIRHTSTRDNLAASFGCRSAIRAGDALTIHEMRQLVDDLYAASMPYACPHGRPIIIEVPLEEFDRRFGRTS